MRILIEKCAVIDGNRDAPPTHLLKSGHHQAWMSPLMIAASNGDEDVMRYLISCGADPKYSDDHTGDTALLCVCDSGSIECVTLLLEAGVTINAVEIDSDNTPLHAAIDYRHSGVALLLLEWNADCDIANNDGDTALDMAARSSLNDVTEVLMSKGALFRSSSSTESGKT